MKQSAVESTRLPPTGFGVYVHWPFCESKCPYCDFNSHVVQGVDDAAWQDALVREIERGATEVPDRLVGSIFFGGGTPSLMPAATVGAVIDRVRACWPTRNDIEITLEANPGSADEARFTGYREAGVNRVSIGVQSLREEPLRQLGRRHGVDEARRAVRLAQRIFSHVSFDLIYARQHQTLADWEDELSEALGFGTDHLSLYQLTIEAGTAFGDRFHRGTLRGLPDEELAARMYERTQEICDGAGLPQYEISNHAIAGGESRHNMLYWTGGDFLGVGPGAHGRLTLKDQRWATVQHRTPVSWLTAALEDGGEAERAVLSSADEGNEYLIMGLRTKDGIEIARANAVWGSEPDRAGLQHLCDIGLLDVGNGRLRATDHGRLVLNTLVAALSGLWTAAD